jgi:hypothetical protein
MEGLRDIKLGWLQKDIVKWRALIVVKPLAL